MFKKHSFFLIYLVAILGFTCYFVLDTLVIERVEQKVDITDSGIDISSIEKTVTNNSYSDENIEINIKEYNYNNTVVYVADVVLKSNDYLKTGFAKSSYGKNVTDYTSSIANSLNAILAINGDYYGVQEKGYVLKNGVVYRDTADSSNQDLVIYKDGTWKIINESQVGLNELVQDGAYNILAFGPALVVNGKINVSENTEVGKAMASNPRTAIGKVSDNHYVFVVSDGRTNASVGLSLYELAEFMQDLGCDIAYNLDGGGSSTMVFNGKVINNPTTNGRISERKVSDIVYIGY